MFCSLDKLPLKFLFPNECILRSGYIRKTWCPQKSQSQLEDSLLRSYQSQRVSQQILCDTSASREVSVQNFPTGSHYSCQPAALFHAKWSFVKVCSFSPTRSSLKCISGPLHYVYNFRTALFHSQGKEIHYYLSIMSCCCSLYYVFPSGLKHEYDLHNICLENSGFVFLPVNN